MNFDFNMPCFVFYKMCIYTFILIAVHWAKHFRSVCTLCIVRYLKVE